MYGRPRFCKRKTDLTGCASHLFHPPRKLWNFRPLPDIFAGMDKAIEIFLTIVREAVRSQNLDFAVPADNLIRH